MSNLEIERKYLIKEFPDNPELVFSEIYEIKQGYITMPEDEKEVRLRRKEKEYYITVKDSGDLVREEHETEITKEQFKSLWPATSGKRLVKVRNVMYYGSCIIRVDLYKGNLLGLSIAEVKFSSVKDSEKFKKPGWFGDEITDENKYKNKSLALMKSLKDLK